MPKHPVCFPMKCQRSSLCSSAVDVSTILIRTCFSKLGRREAYQVPLSDIWRLHSCRCQNSGQPTQFSTDWGSTHPGSRAWHPHSLNLTCELSVSTLQDNCRVSWRGIQLSNSGGAVVTGPPPPCRPKTKMTCSQLKMIHLFSFPLSSS